MCSVLAEVSLTALCREGLELETNTCLTHCTTWKQPQVFYFISLFYLLVLLRTLKGCCCFCMVGSSLHQCLHPPEFPCSGNDGAWVPILSHESLLSYPGKDCSCPGDDFTVHTHLLPRHSHFSSAFFTYNLLYMPVGEKENALMECFKTQICFIPGMAQLRRGDHRQTLFTSTQFHAACRWNRGDPLQPVGSDRYLPGSL